METQEKPALGFVHNRLPWIIGAAALLLYAATLSSWARLDSLLPMSTASGWSIYVAVRAPLLQVMALPLRVLLPVRRGVMRRGHRLPTGARKA